MLNWKGCGRIVSVLVNIQTGQLQCTRQKLYFLGQLACCHQIKLLSAVFSYSLSFSFYGFSLYGAHSAVCRLPTTYSHVFFMWFSPQCQIWYLISTIFSCYGCPQYFVTSHIHNRTIHLDLNYSLVCSCLCIVYSIHSKLDAISA